MLRQVYLGIGSALLAGYLGWSVLGMEFASGRDPIPTEPRFPVSTGSGSSRSSGGFFGGGGGGFGK